MMIGQPAAIDPRPRQGGTLKKTKMPFRLTDPVVAMVAAAVLAMVLLFSLVH
jgi:hypothetical protein